MKRIMILTSGGDAMIGFDTAFSMVVGNFCGDIAIFSDLAGGTDGIISRRGDDVGL